MYMYASPGLIVWKKKKEELVHKSLYVLGTWVFRKFLYILLEQFWSSLAGLMVSHREGVFPLLTWGAVLSLLKAPHQQFKIFSLWSQIEVPY